MIAETGLLGAATSEAETPVTNIAVAPHTTLAERKGVVMVAGLPSVQSLVLRSGIDEGRTTVATPAEEEDRVVLVHRTMMTEVEELPAGIMVDLVVVDTRNAITVIATRIASQLIQGTTGLMSPVKEIEDRWNPGGAIVTVVEVAMATTEVPVTPLHPCMTSIAVEAVTTVERLLLVEELEVTIKIGMIDSVRFVSQLMREGIENPEATVMLQGEAMTPMMPRQLITKSDHTMPRPQAISE